MAWSTPRDWTTGEVVTAAVMNTYVRDQQDVLDSAAINSYLCHSGSAPAWRTGGTDFVGGSGSSSSTSFIDLDGDWGFGTGVIVSVTTHTKALILYKARLSNDTQGALTILSWRCSGATTTAASENNAVWYESSNAADVSWQSGFDYVTLTAGTNEFELQARVVSGTGTINRPELVVLPF
jgi:hypothetical protein